MRRDEAGFFQERTLDVIWQGALPGFNSIRVGVTPQNARSDHAQRQYGYKKSPSMLEQAEIPPVVDSPPSLPKEGRNSLFLYAHPSLITYLLELDSDPLAGGE